MGRGVGIIGGALVLAFAAHAETTVELDGAVIEGTVAAPAGVRVESRAADPFEPMIHERSSFRDEMSDAMPEVEATPVPAPMRVAQAGSVDPCHDELYLELKVKPLESLSDREFQIFKAKDQACNDARVRAVATPAPVPTAAPPVVTTPPEFRDSPAPPPSDATPRGFGPQRWGAKELLLLMFGGVALLLLMVGGMLLLLAVLAP